MTPRTTSHRITRFGQWTTSLGADGALQFVLLRRTGDTVTATRLRDGSGGDAETQAVWSELVSNGDADAWFLTEWVFGEASSLVPYTRLRIRSDASDVLAFTTPLGWNTAYMLRARELPR